MSFFSMDHFGYLKKEGLEMSDVFLTNDGFSNEKKQDPTYSPGYNHSELFMLP